MLGKPQTILLRKLLIILEKNKSETPTKKIGDITSRTTQNDMPTTSMQKEPVSKEIDDQSNFSNLIKIQTSFNIENKLAKLKIPIPLT